MEQALLATEMAEKITVSVSEMTELSNNQKQIFGSSQSISIYSLPGENYCVPTFDNSEIPFVHVMNKKVRYYMISN